jgi:hypothetical protein
MIIEAVYDDVEFTDSDRALLIKKDREKGYITTEAVGSAIMPCHDTCAATPGTVNCEHLCT